MGLYFKNRGKLTLKHLNNKLKISSDLLGISSPEPSEEICQSSLLHLFTTAFSLWQCIYILLKTLADNI